MYVSPNQFFGAVWIWRKFLTQNWIYRNIYINFTVDQIIIMYYTISFYQISEDSGFLFICIHYYAWEEHNILAYHSEQKHLLKLCSSISCYFCPSLTAFRYVVGFWMKALFMRKLLFSKLHFCVHDTFLFPRNDKKQMEGYQSLERHFSLLYTLKLTKQFMLRESSTF